MARKKGFYYRPMSELLARYHMRLAMASVVAAGVYHVLARYRPTARADSLYSETADPVVDTLLQELRLEQERVRGWWR
jgi:hypothetical protein